jgi:hypothetical protein
LPISFEELAIVGSSFQVTPLIGAVENGSDFYVLAVSLNRVRLIHGTRFGLHEIALKDAPQGLVELGYEFDTAELQYHSIPARGAGHHTAIFHGHGGGGRPEHELILHYLRQIDENLRRVLRGSSAPLILAGDVAIVPAYQRANRYPHLMRECVIGNPDDEPLELLHRQAWPIVAKRLDHVQQRIVARVGEALVADQGVTKVDQVVNEASAGRVRTLLVPRRQHAWGRWVSANGQVQVHEKRERDSDDLLNLAAIHTLKHAGLVAVVDRDRMPNGSLAAAELRYNGG